MLAACGQGEVDRSRILNTPPGGMSFAADTVDRDMSYPEPQAPWLSLPAGARYFERDGIRAPVLMRNISAPSVAAFTPLFEAASEAGTSVVRLQLSQGFGYETLGMSNDGGR